MRLVRLLALRHLWRHPLRAALAVVGVAAGTALAVSVLVVQTSTSRSVEEFGRRLSGPTELRVVGAVRRGGLSPEVVDAVAATEGVGAVVPLVQGVTIAERPGAARGDERPVAVLGVDCRAEALVGAFGCTDDLVAGAGDAPLLVGPGVDRDAVLRTHVGPVALDGAPTGGGVLDDLAGGDVVVLGLDAAQRLFGRGDRVDVAYVDPAPGADVAGLRARLADVVGDRGGVLDATDGPPEIDASLADVLPIFTLMALFALGTGGMLVFNTASLSVEERRRDLAVLGALGGTPRLVAATTLAEALVVGAVGGALGAAGGLVVAGPIVSSLSSYTRRVAGIPLSVHAGSAPLVVGLVLGVVVSLLAAGVPVRRAVRTEAAAELSGRGLRAEASAPVAVRRAVAWAVLVVAGLVLVALADSDGGLEPWQVPAGAAGFALTAVAMVMVGASVAAVALRPLARVTRGRAADHLAVANLVRDPRRTGVMVAAVGAAVTTAFVTAGYGNGVRMAIEEDILDNLDGVSVSAVDVGANVNIDTGLEPEVVERLRALPGVASVDGGANVLAGAEAGDLMSVVAFEDPWFDDGEEGVRGTYDRARFEAGAAVINTTLARDEGLRPGDRVALPTPDGAVDVPVMVIQQGGGASGRTVLIPWSLHRRLYGAQPQRSVTVVPEAGTSTAELVGAIEAAGLGDATTVRTPAALAGEASDNADAQLAPFQTLQRGLLAVSFVAVLSTLLLVGVQRRKEFGLLGALGTEPGTLARMVVAEAAAVGLAAGALGVVSGLVMLYAIVLVAPLLIGFDTPFAPAWAPYAGAVVVSLVVTLAASLWPARRAARTDVVLALRDE